VLAKQHTEVTVFFADAAVILVLLSVALSLWWFGRVAQSSGTLEGQAVKDTLVGALQWAL